METNNVTLIHHRDAEGAEGAQRFLNFNLNFLNTSTISAHRFLMV